jgi:hypothetical protein
MNDAVQVYLKTVSQTEKDLAMLRTQVAEAMAYFPSDLNPINLLDRINRITDNMDGRAIEAKLIENRLLMEKLLSLTEFQGDFGVVDNLSLLLNKES